jgi:hypothetical protein
MVCSSIRSCITSSRTLLSPAACRLADEREQYGLYPIPVFPFSPSSERGVMSDGDGTPKDGGGSPCKGDSSPLSVVAARKISTDCCWLFRAVANAAGRAQLVLEGRCWPTGFSPDADRCLTCVKIHSFVNGLIMHLTLQRRPEMGFNSPPVV